MRHDPSGRVAVDTKYSPSHIFIGKRKAQDCSGTPPSAAMLAPGCPRTCIPFHCSVQVRYTLFPSRESNHGGPTWISAIKRGPGARILASSRVSPWSCVHATFQNLYRVHIPGNFHSKQFPGFISARKRACTHSKPLGALDLV